MVALLNVFSNGVAPDLNGTGFYNFNRTSTMGVRASEIRNFGVYQLFINQTTTTPIDPTIFSCLKSAISISFYNPHPDSIGSVPGYDRKSLNDNIVNSTSIHYLMIIGPNENSPFPYNIENLKTDYLTLM
ncbi:hypothetical protein ACTFIY_012375 [Dictyostelium cf. discoideum]